jgi:hypothetical protein
MAGSSTMSEIKISNELANAMMLLVHERWMSAAVKGAKDKDYWQKLQLECEGIRNKLVAKELGLEKDNG